MAGKLAISKYGLKFLWAEPCQKPPADAPVPVRFQADTHDATEQEAADAVEVERP